MRGLPVYRVDRIKESYVIMECMVFHELCLCSFYNCPQDQVDSIISPAFPLLVEILAEQRKWTNELKPNRILMKVKCTH